mgnify:CR=1 FL=1
MGDIIMDNLLKEAIADAKAVRETALQNAKIALEEAFTPKIQSMLSQKIQQEIDDEDELGDEVPGDEEVPEEEPIVAQDEVPGDEEEEFPAEPEPAWNSRPLPNLRCPVSIVDVALAASKPVGPGPGGSPGSSSL